MGGTSKGDEAAELRVLHDIALALHEAETVEEICQLTVEAAEAVLEFDNCIIALEAGGELPIRAQSSAISSDGVTPTMSINEGIAGKTYRTQTAHRFDDVSTIPEANPQGPYKAALSVPIGEKGIFQTVSTKAGVFTEADQKLVEVLISHTESALTRVEYEQELERFVGVISHDLRNPLQVARGYVEQAQEECPSDVLDPIEEMHTRMETIIDELLVVAQQDELVDPREWVQLRHIVNESWQAVATQDATLECDVPPGSYLKADPDCLQQVFENLFRNAVEHAGPVVTVRVGVLDDGFYVEDDGAGLPTDTRHKLFEWGHSTTEQGTGYGLYIVKQLIQAHEWYLTAKPGTDDGARFEVTGVEFSTK